LISQVGGQPFATHLPFLLEGDTLVAHMARANPQWHGFSEGCEVLCTFQGPHAYVSPSWYTAKNAVPTWNYAAVHVYGKPEIIDDPQAAYIDQEKLVEFNEAGYDKPWRLGDCDREFIDGMIRAIVNFRIPITRIEGKFKLSQNRPVEDRERVAVRLEASTDHATEACGLLMAAWR